MDLAFAIMQMVRFMKEHGKMIKNKDKENLIF